jgi:hypothetical protein
MLDRRVVRGDQPLALQVAYEHWQRVLLEQRAVALLARAERLAGGAQPATHQRAERHDGGDKGRGPDDE